MALAVLKAALAQVLADAELVAQPLPACPQLQLYLLQQDYPVSALDNETAQRVMNNPLYWLFCWASGHALASRILAEPALVAGKVVMDVGAGSGVVAIACVMAGAKQVIASDIDAVAQHAIRANAQLNGISLEVIGDYRDYPGAVDLIILADVLYDSDNIPLLQALLQRAPAMLLADSRVRNFSYPGLVRTATCDGETFPNLGGFDEFFEVNIYQSE